MAEMEKRAKLFRNGGSQAVRLPKEFQFAGMEVRIRREGQSVVLEPVGPQVGAKELATVRRVIQSVAPHNPEFAGMVDEAMRKLQGNQDDPGGR
jgi:virulence-associated protein VagC